MAETAEKKCVKCGVDLSSQKRHKDAKGRYWCEPCYGQAVAAAKAKKEAKERAKAGADEVRSTGAAAAASASGYGVAPSEAEVMSHVLAGSKAVQGKVCPQCHNPIEAEAVLCTNCGFREDAGKQMQTKVKLAPKQKESKGQAGTRMKGPALSGILSNPLLYLFAGFAIGGGPLMAYASTDFLMPALVLLSLLSFGLFIWVLVQGFLTSTISGVLLIVTYFIPLVNLYWLYFVFWRNESVLLKMVFGGYLVGGLITFVTVASGSLPGIEELVQASS